MDTRAMWAERVADWKASGLSSVKFCQDKPFTAGGLRHWAYRLRKEPAPPPRKRKKEKAPAVSVARVVVTRPPVLESQAEPAARPAGSDKPLVLEYGQARLSIEPGFEPATLAAVLDVLDARGGAR